MMSLLLHGGFDKSGRFIYNLLNESVEFNKFSFEIITSV